MPAHRVANRRSVLKAAAAIGTLWLRPPDANVLAQSDGVVRLLRAPKIALVIGNSAYRNAPALRNPVNDARAMAETLKALKSPVRTIARSGVKLTTVSQVTVQNLIELQSDVVTAALNDVAMRLERATRAENIIEFVREQIELTPATRARVVEDATRAVTIFKTAGRDLRNVARHAYVSIVEKAEKEAEAPKAAARRKTAAVKRATRKTVKRALSGQDKGQRAEIGAFVEAVRSGGPMPIPLESLVATTRATLAVGTSLIIRQPVALT